MKTVTLTLGQATLVLGPLLAATIRDHRAAITRSRQGDLEPIEMMELTCILAHACARRVQPDITIEQVEQLIDTDNYIRVFTACWGVSVPEVPPGEALQAVQANPST